MAVKVNGPILSIPVDCATNADPQIKEAIRSKNVAKYLSINLFNPKLCYFDESHFSASSAAIQPIAAAVTACL